MSINVNDIFRKVAKSPLLLWSILVSVILISLGLSILVIPSLTGFDTHLRYGLGGMLTIYGIYRFGTFYRGIKDRDDA